MTKLGRTGNAVGSAGADEVQASTGSRQARLGT
jgi:hypothetical protein